MAWGRQPYLAAAVFLAASLALILASTWHSAPFWDEPTYISAGYYFLKTGDPSVIVGHPMVTKILAGALPYFVRPSLPANSVQLINESYVKFAYDFMYKSGNDATKLVFLARLPFVLLVALLGLLIFMWAKDLFGAWAGALSVFLYSFSPLILAYGGIALTDLPVSLFAFASSYFFWKFAVKGKKKFAFFSALAFGLALGSKLTTIYLVPIFAVLFAFMLLRGKKAPILVSRKPFYDPLRRPAINSLAQFVVLACMFIVISGAVLFVLYGFQFGTLSSGVPERYLPRGYDFVAKAFGENAAAAATFAAEKVPIPFPSFFAGYFVVGYASLNPAYHHYMLGKVYLAGDWRFYPLSLLLKTPLSFIILLGLAAFCLLRTRRDMISEAALLVPPAVFVLAFLPSSYNAGVRHLLPIFPFLFVFAGRLALVPSLFKSWKKAAVSVLLACLFLWYLLGSLLAFPYYGSYFNELVPKGHAAYYFVGDNLDAGENLNRLAAYLNANNISRVNLSYFGSADPAYYGINYDYMPSPFFQAWTPSYSPSAEGLPANFTEDCSARKGLVAVSAANLKGVYLLNRSCYSWLGGYKPIAVVGNTIFIYDFRDDSSMVVH